MFIKDKIARIDPLMFICTTLLSVISIVVLIGARESAFAGTRNLVMQIAMTLLGMIIMIIFASVDFDNLPNWVFFAFYAVSAALLVLLLCICWSPFPVGSRSGLKPTSILSFWYS